MDDPTDPGASPWSASPTAKAKNAVQRSVTALLDELAPERVLKRVERLPGGVEQHRTPTGCVLQAAAAAVSVTWFPDPGNDIGELHVLSWHGRVTRRGAPPSKKGATIVGEIVLLPIEPPTDTALWRASDGTQYDTVSLAAKCIALLEEQVRVAG